MAPKPVMIGVDIVFSKPMFMPDENVEGTVTLTTNKTEDALECLTLEITGTESAYVPSADRPGLLTGPALLTVPGGGFQGDMGYTGEMTCVSERRQICRGVQTLATLSNAALEPRTHSWPFKFKIPAGAPPTQKTGNAKCADMWEVSYEAYARLEFSARDKHRGVFGRKAPIRVWCPPRPHVDTPPKVVGPEVFPVRSRVPWGKSGSMTIAVKLARTTFSLGEPIEVSILAQKASSIAIKEVLIEVFQTTAWSAKGKSSNAQRVLASRVVRTGELQSPVGQQLYFGDGTPADTMAGLESQNAELASSLLGGMCGVFEIQVPEEKHDYFLDAAGFPQTSFGTKLDQFVRVTVKTGKASGTTPVVMCPIQVVNNMAQTK